jgi:hypothetical protein
MRLLLLGALAALVLAGCVAPNAVVAPGPLDAAAAAAPGAHAHVFATADGKLVTDALAGMPVALGGEYLTGFYATEPTIGVTKDGAVFMTAMRPNPTFQAQPFVPHLYLQRSPTLVRSTDQGRTWKDVFSKLPTGDGQTLTSWDPYVYVDRDTGRVFMDDIFPLSCGTMSFSDDKGATWTTDPYSCGNTQVNDHQTVVAAKPRALPLLTSYPKLVYRCVNNLAYAACAVSLTGGLTFLPQIPAMTQQQGCAAITGHLDADKEGRVFLPGTCNGFPAYAMTEDDGRTWTVTAISKTVKTSGHDTDLAFDDAGNVYAVWELNNTVYFADSVDHGKTWSEARKIVPPTVTGTQFDAIAAGSPGHVAIAYVGTEVPGGYEGKKEGDCPLTSNDCSTPPDWANATWNAYLTIATNALDPSATFQTVTANPPSDPIARGYCGHSRCHGMNDFVDVTIDSEGRPWASFVDVCTQKCVTDAGVFYDKDVGFAGTLQSGPSLRGDGLLSPLAPPVPSTSS